jgi:dihydrofolate reductase/thymidylate synthase
MQLVATAERGWGVGRGGQRPWADDEAAVAADAARFERLTLEGSRNAVVMGRRTWESLPPQRRPLPGRLNVVVSSRAPLAGVPSDVLVCGSLGAALDVLAALQPERVFVIGGARLFAEALAEPLVSRVSAIHLALLDRAFDGCDAFFPAERLDCGRFRVWSSVVQNARLGMALVTYVAAPSAAVPAALPPAAPRHEEMQYLELVERVLSTGALRPDRTGTGTYSLFGCSMRFDLRHTFPLFTTKRVFWRGVVEELLWFVAGGTSTDRLRERGVHIWDANGSRAFLDARGLTGRAEGDLGPVYGFQWRHFGAAYVDAQADYAGQGVDQLADLVSRVRAAADGPDAPNDRRLVLTAWNPAALHQMALPPCHMFCQFHVGVDRRLSCQLYQRSCDLGLGVPFNVASYALLTHMVAHACGLLPGELVHCMGDTHVYATHAEPLHRQLARTPRPFPTLRVAPSAPRDIDALAADHFELVGYDPHPKVDMPLAV